LSETAGILHGSVADYDETAGYGTVLDEQGRRWWFHCTAIAGGDRRIATGTGVSFRLVPGRLGRREAVDLTTR
jgi:cold shock CspA family protein